MSFKIIIFPLFFPFLIFFNYLFILHSINGFEAIPFLQIDYNFYLRLAQCEAKCSEKFSSINKRKIIAPSDSQSLTDKNYNQQMAIGSSLMLQNICQQGCLDSDAPLPQKLNINQIDTQPNNAFVLGQQFFKESSFLLLNSSFSSFFGFIRPLCVQKTNSLSSSSSTYSLNQEKFESFLIFENLKGEILKENVRFVVRWRRKQIKNENYNEEKEEEEPQWITASIESSPRFKVSSLRPGLFYQFQVQAVSPNGIQVPEAFSDWIDFSLYINGFGINKKSLQFYSQFNSDYKVAAWVSWKLVNDEKILEKEDENEMKESKPILTARLGRHLLQRQKEDSNVTNISILPNNKFNKQRPLISSFVVFPYCQLQIEWANKSSRDSEIFELDGSDGFLLSNLAFNSEYWVTLKANNYNNSNNVEVTTTLLEGNFLSMKCVQVYGFGSLECKPEPVKHLSIFTFPKNGSAQIKWERPQVVANILLYEINIEPIIKDDLLNIKNKCKIEDGLLNAKIVAAQANSTWILLPQEAVCEFEVRHTLYDLLGRDATTTIRFIYTTITEESFSSLNNNKYYYSLAFGQFISKLDISTFFIIFIILFIPITAFIAFICTLKRGNTRQKIKQRRKPLKAEKNNLMIKKTKIEQNTNSNIKRSVVIDENSLLNYKNNINGNNSLIITSLEKYPNNYNINNNNTPIKQQILNNNKIINNNNLNNISPHSSSCISSTGSETTVTLLPFNNKGENVENNYEIKLNNNCLGNLLIEGRQQKEEKKL